MRARCQIFFKAAFGKPLDSVDFSTLILMVYSAVSPITAANNLLTIANNNFLTHLGFILVHHLLIILEFLKFLIKFVIVVGDYRRTSLSTNSILSLSSTANFEPKEQFQQIHLGRYPRIFGRWAIGWWIDMIFDEMEFFFRIYLTDFSSNIHLTKYLINFAHLLFNLGKDRCAVKGAADDWVPVPAMLPQHFFISVN